MFGLYFSASGSRKYEVCLPVYFWFTNPLKYFHSLTVNFIANTKVMKWATQCFQSCNSVFQNRSEVHISAWGETSFWSQNGLLHLTFCFEKHILITSTINESLEYTPQTCAANTCIELRPGVFTRQFISTQDSLFDKITN